MISVLLFIILCVKRKLCKLGVPIFEVVDKRAYICTQYLCLGLMLKQLSIQNYLLVENLVVDVTMGMPAYTGE